MQILSYVQTRGSVPAYWAEINSLRYVPKLQVRGIDTAAPAAILVAATRAIAAPITPAAIAIAVAAGAILGRAVIARSVAAASGIAAVPAGAAAIGLAVSLALCG